MKQRKSLNITVAIFLGLILGILFGLFMPGRYEFLLPAVDLISSLYMNALRMMIYPLVFCSLIVGIQGIGSISATGRVGGQAVLYFIATTLFASLLGLFLPKALGIGTPGVPGGAIASFAALASIAGLPAGIMGVYISINTLCDMGATCCNVLGDLACSVAIKQTVRLEEKPEAGTIK